MDGAVVVDVDLGAGLGHDLLDDGAALADDVAGKYQSYTQADATNLLTRRRISEFYIRNYLSTFLHLAFLLILI